MNPRAGYPTYRISSADPSATWVHLRIPGAVMQFLLYAYRQSSSIGKGIKMLFPEAPGIVIFVVSLDTIGYNRNVVLLYNKRIK